MSLKMKTILRSDFTDYNFANISRIIHKLSHFKPQVKIANELFQ